MAKRQIWRGGRLNGGCGADRSPRCPCSANQTNFRSECDLGEKLLISDFRVFQQNQPKPDHDEGRAGDQVMRLQVPMDRSF